MGKTFTIVPAHGSYRTGFDFVADSLNAPGGIPAGQEGFSQFLQSIAVHNGCELMLDGHFAIEVEVMCREDEFYDEMVLYVNHVFEWETYEFLPLVYDKEGRLTGWRMSLEASSFIIEYGLRMFERFLAEWDEAELTPLERIIDLSARLMDERTPWAGYVHVRTIPMLDDYGPEQGRSPISAFAWRFMDGSLAFLTEQGVKTQHQFQTYCTDVLQIPFIDVDFEVLAPSARRH